MNTNYNSNIKRDHQPYSYASYRKNHFNHCGSAQNNAIYFSHHSSTDKQKHWPPKTDGTPGINEKYVNLSNLMHRMDFKSHGVAKSNSVKKREAVEDGKCNLKPPDTGYGSAESSFDSEDEKDLTHILEPQSSCSINEPRKCLTWACKACKRKTVSIDRRKAATLRERRRLRKVSSF